MPFNLDAAAQSGIIDEAQQIGGKIVGIVRENIGGRRMPFIKVGNTIPAVGSPASYDRYIHNSIPNLYLAKGN